MVNKDKFVVGGKRDRVESRASGSRRIKDDLCGDFPDNLSYAFRGLQASMSAGLEIEIEQSYPLFHDQAYTSPSGPKLGVTGSAGTA